MDLRIPLSHSLKEKRAVVKPILEGARRRYSVAAAEVGHQDRWQRATLGFAAVGPDAGVVAEVLGHVERFVWSFPEAEVLDATVGYAEVDGGA
ncbi:MAG: DUF503 domain-containing protein [Acidimicrobiales bacterium]